jgi:hypothetical protein
MRCPHASVTPDIESSWYKRLYTCQSTDMSYRIKNMYYAFREPSRVFSYSSIDLNSSEKFPLPKPPQPPFCTTTPLVSSFSMQPILWIISIKIVGLNKTHHSLEHKHLWKNNSICNSKPNYSPEENFLCNNNN